jgi:hypothetical protein
MVKNSTNINLTNNYPARQLAEKALQDAEEEKKVFHKEENIRGGIPLLTGFTLSHICSCPKQGPRFPTSYIMQGLCLRNSLDQILQLIKEIWTLIPEK